MQLAGYGVPSAEPGGHSLLELIWRDPEKIGGD
jgi:hypothetical protein